MDFQIRRPKLNELEKVIEVFYLAFKGEFTYIFGKYFEIGKKLLSNFYKKIIKKEDLENFLVATVNGKIVAAANLDFSNFKFLKFLSYFLKLNVHFLLAHSILGFRRTIRITLAMYWFFIENFRINSCYINLFAVLPKFQKGGIGTKMLKKIEILTRRRQLSSMTLDVAFSDAPARYLYEKMGFIEVNRYQNSVLKYLNAIEGFISMEKRL